jgi:ankyrin repeat protein
MTALMVAADKGHVEAVKVLLDRGANLDLQDKVSSLGGWRAKHRNLFLLLNLLFSPS